MLALFIAGLALIGPSGENDWTIVTVARNNLMAVDRTTVVRRGDEVLFWVIYAPVTSETTDDGLSYDYQVQRWEGDCARSTFKIVSNSMFELSGRLVDMRPVDMPLFPATPDSEAGDILETVCSGEWGYLPPLRTARDVARLSQSPDGEISALRAR